MADVSLIPVSKAKTAFGLLSEVAKVALAEPKRIYMGLWGGQKGNFSRLTSDVTSSGYENIGLHIDKRPACDTVGCIGGWTEALKPGKAASLRLGLSPTQAECLFYPYRLCEEPNQGTLAHAKKVVAHIKRFQKKYSSQLKRTKV